MKAILRDVNGYVKRIMDIFAGWARPLSKWDRVAKRDHVQSLHKSNINSDIPQCNPIAILKEMFPHFFRKSFIFLLPSNDWNLFYVRKSIIMIKSERLSGQQQRHSHSSESSRGQNPEIFLRKEKNLHTYVLR